MWLDGPLGWSGWHRDVAARAKGDRAALQVAAQARWRGAGGQAACVYDLMVMVMMARLVGCQGSHSPAAAADTGFNAVYLDNFVRPSRSPLPPRVELVCSGAPNPNLETCTPNQGSSKIRS
jgi:hypothetical protein